MKLLTNFEHFINTEEMNLDVCWDQQFSLITLKGEGARNFLNGQTSVDVISKRDGELFLSCWLSTNGGVRALLEIKLYVGGAFCIVIGGDHGVVKSAFENVIFPSDNVTLEKERSIRRMQLLSSKSPELINKIIWIDSMSQAPHPFHSFTKADEFYLESWRIKNSLPIGLNEINDKNNPFELGLSSIINLDKGCYLGQEAMARFSRLGDSRKQLMFWESDDPISENEKLFVLTKDQEVVNSIGIITSSLQLSESGKSIGLAIVKRSKSPINKLYVNSPKRCISMYNQEPCFDKWTEFD